MTAAEPAFLASIVDCLEECVPVQTRDYFGGTGLVCAGVRFAMVMGTTVYFVVDPATRARYEAAAAEPFSYLARRGRVTVHRYYTVPGHVLDDARLLRAWAEDAVDAAARPSRRT
jgi:TfoX/Sxy family transcriptional regulator of competence genes